MKAKELSTGQHDRRSGEAGQQGLELECDQVKWMKLGVLCYGYWCHDREVVGSKPGGWTVETEKEFFHLQMTKQDETDVQMFNAEARR